MSIGTHIRGLRKSRGLTQEALAAEAGISQSTVSEIENDVRMTDADIVMRLMAILGGCCPPVRQSALVSCDDIMAPWQTRLAMRASEISFDVRINQARQTLGRQVVDELMRQLRAREEGEWWLSILRRWPFESGLEAVLAVRLLLEGAVMTKARLARLGFPLPIVDPKTKVHTGNLARWSLALIGQEVRVIFTPCVTLQCLPLTSRTGRRRLDLTVVAQVGSERYCGAIETDGAQHRTPQGQAEDRAREEEIDLPIHRISESDLAGGAVLPAIKRFILHLPADERSHAGVCGKWR
ncbi:MAG TPA: helix-turn-helix transcriptional regulator [Candidatus Xenobia bacterium]|jgi:DNA-binding XRE family transcriptional regulator